MLIPRARATSPGGPPAGRRRPAAGRPRRRLFRGEPRAGRPAAPNATGPKFGAENINFYRTRLDYDKQGRLTRVQTPTGTIYRTVFDGMGRAMSEWVGTDDTPATGGWSPGNWQGTDLRKVRDYIYDN